MTGNETVTSVNGYHDTSSPGRFCDSSGVRRNDLLIEQGHVLKFTCDRMHIWSHHKERKANDFVLQVVSTHPGGKCLVTKREVLEELSLQNLQKVADRLGIRVSKGLTGVLTQAMFGPVTESRRTYIEALAGSDVVTLEEIDRILHTRYSRLPDDTRGVGLTPKSRGTLSEVFSFRRADTRADRFFSLDSLLQHILDSYVTKSDLQKICQNLGIPGAGNKGDLVTRVLGDSRLTKEIALYYVNRDDMKKLCEDLKLPATGTRREMESRVVNVMMRLPRAPPNTPSHEPPQYSPPMVQAPWVVPYANPPQQTPIAAPPAPSPGYIADTGATSGKKLGEGLSSEPHGASTLASPQPSVPEILPVPSIPPRPEFDGVVRFIDEWRPTKPYKDEVGYEVELDTRLRTTFGDTCVKNQLHILDGRIDVEVMGIGIELKVPTNKAMLQRLVGQTRMYRKHYGPNLVVVIITGKAKLQDILAFKSDLEEDGIKVLVK